MPNPKILPTLGDPAYGAALDAFLARPVRLRLSRARGFDLQAHSRAVNGLPAVNVARSGSWGNPFVVTSYVGPGKKIGGGYYAVPTVEDAVECHRLMLEENRPDMAAAAQQTLRGKNLACWCKESPCHADTLLRIANAPLVCEAASVPMVETPHE